MPHPVMPAEPWAGSARRFAFFQIARLMERAWRGYPRIGSSSRPVDDPVRFGQRAELGFIETEVAEYRASADGPARLTLNAFGLLGPEGPLPLHFTEYVRDRQRNAGDGTWSAFLDVFHHRLISLLYRSWANVQPAVCFDRPEDDAYARYVGSLAGCADAAARTDAVHAIDPSLQFCGLLGGRTRHASGLAQILTQYFGVGAAIQPHVGRWLALPHGECTRLGVTSRVLGQGLALGRRVWDRQHKFRVVLGPLDRPGIARLQPGTESFGRLATWVRRYNRDALDWDVALRLAPGTAEPMRLGPCTRLGRSSWIGQAESRRAEPVLCFKPDRPSSAVVEDECYGGNQSGRAVRKTERVGVSRAGKRDHVLQAARPARRRAGTLAASDPAGT